MKLKDILAPEGLFYPKTFYEGEWLLGGEYTPTNRDTDYLVLNAKNNSGKNAYLDFLERNYFKPLENILDSKGMARKFFPKIALTVDDKIGKRVVRFSLSVFIMEQISGLFSSDELMQKFRDFIEEDNSIENYPNYLKQLLREDRKIFIDIRNNYTKSPYYARFYKNYLEYIQYRNSTMPFSEFLERRISGTTKLIIATRYYPNFFNKEVPIEELLEAFDYDKFCLLAARSALDCCKTTEIREDKIDNCIGYVRVYLASVALLRSEIPTYDCSIVTIDENRKKKVVTIEEIEKEYQTLLSRHPEFSFILISSNEASTLLKKEGIIEETGTNYDFSNKENQEALAAILEKIKESKELVAEWEFIRKGSKKDSETEKSILSYESQTLPEEERIRRMVIGREYLESSNYVYKIYGMNKFQGYVGYIYANGTVIFEKYYENITMKKVASSSATYVMGLDNFIEMSKLSKTEIIQMIKTDSSTNVRRIFHRADMDRWKSDIERAITGSNYTQDVIDYIDTLIFHKSIQKSGEKS